MHRKWFLLVLLIAGVAVIKWKFVKDSDNSKKVTIHFNETFLDRVAIKQATINHYGRADGFSSSESNAESKQLHHEVFDLDRQQVFKQKQASAAANMLVQRLAERTQLSNETITTMQQILLDERNQALTVQDANQNDFIAKQQALQELRQTALDKVKGILSEQQFAIYRSLRPL